MESRDRWDLEETQESWARRGGRASTESTGYRVPQETSCSYRSSQVVIQRRVRRWFLRSRLRLRPSCNRPRCL